MGKVKKKLKKAKKKAKKKLKKAKKKAKKKKKAAKKKSKKKKKKKKKKKSKKKKSKNAKKKLPDLFSVIAGMVKAKSQKKPSLPHSISHAVKAQKEHKMIKSGLSEAQKILHRQAVLVEKNKPSVMEAMAEFEI